MDMPVSRRYPGNTSARPGWPLKYKYLLYRLYERTKDPLAPPGKGFHTAAMEKALMAAAPEVYDWWCQSHPGQVRPLKDWVGATVRNRIFYMYSSVQAPRVKGEPSTEHPHRWACYLNQTQEWCEIEAWVTDKLAALDA